MIATPHIGAQTHEAQLKASIQVAKAVIEALERKICELRRLVDIRPFKAIRYTQKAGNPENFITQPYDKIDAEMQKEYYQKSPYNYCRLNFASRRKQVPSGANNELIQWLKEGIMAKESRTRSFCFTPRIHSGRKKICERTGIIAALRLYDYRENMVFPHEATYKAPKADRLNMLRTVQKDLGTCLFNLPGYRKGKPSLSWRKL